LTARYDENLLGGVAVLEGEACRMPEGKWDSQLYRSLSSDAGEAVQIALIPYYAWNNRGVTEMTVWMPLV
jgi:DUF1680 family protein